VNGGLLCVVIPADRLCRNVILSVSEGSRSYCYRRDASLRSAWQQLKALVYGSCHTVWEAGIQRFFWIPVCAHISPRCKLVRLIRRTLSFRNCSVPRQKITRLWTGEKCFAFAWEAGWFYSKHWAATPEYRTMAFCLWLKVVDPRLLPLGWRDRLCLPAEDSVVGSNLVISDGTARLLLSLREIAMTERF